MRASDVMSKCVAVCTEDAGLEEVYELLHKCEQKLVVVVDSNAHRVPIGVASEHSICEQIIARGRNPRSLSAGSIMDSRIKKLSENQLLENIDPDELNGLTAIVVVNDDRQITGLISTEAFNRIRPKVVKTAKPLHVSVTVATGSPRRVSEIPAFGWIQ